MKASLTSNSTCIEIQVDILGSRDSQETYQICWFSSWTSATVWRRQTLSSGEFFFRDPWNEYWHLAAVVWFWTMRCHSLVYRSTSSLTWKTTPIPGRVCWLTASYNAIAIYPRTSITRWLVNRTAICCLRLCMTACSRCITAPSSVTELLPAPAVIAWRHRTTFYRRFLAFVIFVIYIRISLIQF